MKRALIAVALVLLGAGLFLGFHSATGPDGADCGTAFGHGPQMQQLRWTASTGTRDDQNDLDACQREHESNTSIATVLLVVGLAALVGGVVYRPTAAPVGPAPQPASA